MSPLFVNNQPSLYSRTPFSAALCKSIESSLPKLELYRHLNTQVCLFKCVFALCEAFTQVEVIEQFGSYIQIRFPRADNSVAKIFATLELMKTTLSVESYSVSQTSLEQIFQSFADARFEEKLQKFYIKRGDPQDSEMCSPAELEFAD